MFVALWEFEVKPGSEERFERVYGPEGTWAKLFQRSRAYKGTRLLRDAARPGVYVTMDLWDSQTAYEAFKKECAQEYQELDRSCEEMTVNETRLGEFEGKE